jgi:hypothetical protein
MGSIWQIEPITPTGRRVLGHAPATNFMIRDQRRQSLIAKTKEPITPFIDKVRQMYDEQGVSTILVIGGGAELCQLFCQNRLRRFPQNN